MTSKDEVTDQEISIESRCEGLECLLRKKFGSDLKLVNASIDQLVPLGQNFGSEIIKISAKIRRGAESPVEELHLVAKLIIENNTPIQIDWSNMFKKEAFMYTDVISLFKEIELEHGVKEGETIENCVAGFYGMRMALDPEVDVADKNAMILLENIKVRGYYVVDKKVGLDFEHALKVVTTMGRFHALGIVAKKNYPDRFELLKPTLFEVGFDINIIITMYDNVLNSMRDNPAFRDYIPRLEALLSKIKSDPEDSYERNEPWTTIIHNDLWTNNLMFHKNEEGKVDGVKLIDFQTYRLADPFLDLCYFLSLTLDNHTKLDRFDELLDVYYQAFASTLRKMDVDVEEFSRDKYDEQMRKDAAIKILHCGVAIHFLTTDVNPETYVRNEMLEQAIMACKGITDLFVKKMLVILRMYEERQWL